MSPRTHLCSEAAVTSSYDPHGSVEALLDQSNGVKAAYGYTAYGTANPQLTKTAGGFTAGTNLYRYSGKRFDQAASAYDMGARHYFPSVGRWFQQDTYTNALDNLGLSADPLTANRYQFTGANPVNYIEIDGHRFVDDDTGKWLAPAATPTSPNTGGNPEQQQGFATEMAACASNSSTRCLSLLALPDSCSRPDIWDGTGRCVKVYAGTVDPPFLKAVKLAKAAKGLWAVIRGGKTAAKSVDDVLLGLAKGKQSGFKTVGSDSELQSVYNRLSRSGTPVEVPGYKGSWVERPDGIRIGLRDASKTGGRTIDVRYPDGTIRKVHIK